MAQRSLRRSTQLSTKASLAVKKQEETPSAADTDTAAISLVAMQKDSTEISNSNTPELAGIGKKIDESTPAAAAAVNEWPPHSWRPLTHPLSPSRLRSRSRSRSRTRDLPPSAVKPSAEASSQAHSEATDQVEALKARLQNDTHQIFSWKQGITARLEGQNRKIDAFFVTANDGVRLAKLADVNAGDAMTRANDAMKQAEDALKRAKNVFNTAVNEHGPSLRKIKERVTDLETKVEELDRDTRVMSRTLIGSGSSAAASGAGGISDLRSDMRRLQRDVDDAYAASHSNEARIEESQGAHKELKAQVDLIVKELAQEKAKVAYLLQRDYASSYGQAPAQQQQQHQQQHQPQQQAHSANVGYPLLPYPMPPISASATAAAPYCPLQAASSQHGRVA